jgi:alkylhydroperoxidase family enzyme
MLPLLPVDESARRGATLGVLDWLATANIFRGLLHSTAGAGAFYGVIDALMFHNTVSSRTRELVILRIGWRAASEYVFCNHVNFSRDLGMSDEEILGVRDPKQCRAYSETDHRVIDLADELYDSARVTPPTWSALESAFTLEELVELVLVAGFWRTIAGFLNTAEIPLDEGVLSWPEGRPPG